MVAGRATPGEVSWACSVLYECPYLFKGGFLFEAFDTSFRFCVAGLSVVLGRMGSLQFDAGDGFEFCVIVNVAFANWADQNLV